MQTHVRRIREAKGVSLRRLGEQIGMPRSTLAYKETCGTFSDAELHRIAQALQVPLVELLPEDMSAGAPQVVPARPKR